VGHIWLGFEKVASYFEKIATTCTEHVMFKSISPKCYNISMTKSLIPVISFSALYLTLGGIYFLRDLNLEFVIYVAVIVAIFAGVFATLRSTQFPVWMLWLLSIWGLMHVAGGAVQTVDGVLFAYKIYPFLDWGGDFYILKYDQVVHAYLYGLVAVMAYHTLRVPLGIKGHTFLVALAATMISLGISGLNEIMEFLIAVSIERNGVGGYANAMIDLIFNLGGAVVGVLAMLLVARK
jgi:putative membrane protein